MTLDHFLARRSSARIWLFFVERQHDSELNFAIGGSVNVSDTTRSAHLGTERWDA
jgi:hypothetical protein